jgi:hypothetical protein
MKTVFNTKVKTKAYIRVLFQQRHIKGVVDSHMYISNMVL